MGKTGRDHHLERLPLHNVISRAIYRRGADAIFMATRTNAEENMPRQTGLPKHRARRACCDNTCIKQLNAGIAYVKNVA